MTYIVMAFIVMARVSYLAPDVQRARVHTIAIATGPRLQEALAHAHVKTHICTHAYTHVYTHVETYVYTHVDTHI